MSKVGVYLLHLGEFLNWPIDGYWHFFSASRQRAILNYRRGADRSRTMWAELLARSLLADWSNMPFKKIAIERDGRGRPYWPDGCLQISLSHSGPWVACSLGKTASGVDVEKKRSLSSLNMTVAKRFFRPTEYEYLENLTEAQQEITFRRYWTIKESYLKYLGVGLSGGLGTPDAASLLAKDGEVSGTNFDLPDGAVVGLCATGDDLPAKAHIWKLTDGVRNMTLDGEIIFLPEIVEEM